MLLEELIELINLKMLNSKTNNIIVSKLQSTDKNKIIERILPSSSILNYEQINEEGFNSREAVNIIVDINNIEYFNILNYALNQLQINEKLKLKTFRDLLRFINLLRQNKKSVQFIICNADKLNQEDIRIFNLLLWINSYFFNSILLLEGKKELSSYQTCNGEFLDNRENYTRLNLIRF